MRQEDNMIVRPGKTLKTPGERSRDPLHQRGGFLAVRMIEADLVDRPAHGKASCSSRLLPSLQERIAGHILFQPDVD